MKKLKISILALLLSIGSIASASDNPIKKTTIKYDQALWYFVDAALEIGLASYIGHMVVNSFDVTKDMQNKTETITGVCVAVYIAFLLSEMYQEELKKSKKCNKDLSTDLVLS